MLVARSDERRTLLETIYHETIAIKHSIRWCESRHRFAENVLRTYRVLKPVTEPKPQYLRALALFQRRGGDSNPRSPCGDSGFQDRLASDATILCDNRLRENGQGDGALFGTRECQCMSQIDADLQQLVEIWPGIPAQFRKQILDLARGLADRSCRDFPGESRKDDPGDDERWEGIGACPIRPKGGPINHTTSDIAQTEWLGSFPTVEHRCAIFGAFGIEKSPREIAASVKSNECTEPVG